MTFLPKGKREVKVVQDQETEIEKGIIRKVKRSININISIDQDLIPIEKNPRDIIRIKII